MNKPLLSALYGMNAIQLSTSAMAHNSAEDSADHVHYDLMSHTHEGHRADDATYNANNANEDRRGKSESGHHRHGRRATDLPDQDDHDDDANNLVSHQ